MLNAVPVVLCGGSGTRLWPLSRAGFPKQFLCLNSKDSLFQQAIHRTLTLSSESINIDAPIVVTGEEHRFLVTEQLHDIGISAKSSVIEPIGKNTAPALTLAALAALEEGRDPVLLVTPADQVIEDQAEFSRSMGVAIGEASKGSIVILGINPSKPETGYGYINYDNLNSNQIFDVLGFTEKPNFDNANKYVNSGNYLWNAGIFVLKASVWISAIKHFRPSEYQIILNSWNERKTDKSFIRPDPDIFNSIVGESIDYAVMEQCSKSPFSLKVVKMNSKWSDLGAWEAVWDSSIKDGNGNASVGDVLSLNCRDTLAHSSHRLITMIGVENIVVIETADVILVADKSRTQDVKRIVSSLKDLKRNEHLLHRKVHRPWGWYDSVDEGERFKVKRIQVKPKASLSLQMHHHRAEHWIVVKGTAEITNGKEVVLLTENQSTYIPLGVTHRLYNPGSIPLEIIEVQSGGYLGEDDIVRFDDSYGRR